MTRKDNRDITDKIADCFKRTPWYVYGFRWTEFSKEHPLVIVEIAENKAIPMRLSVYQIAYLPFVYKGFRTRLELNEYL